MKQVQIVDTILLRNKYKTTKILCIFGPVSIDCSMSFVRVWFERLELCLYTNPNVPQNRFLLIFGCPLFCPFHRFFLCVCYVPNFQFIRRPLTITWTIKQQLSNNSSCVHEQKSVGYKKSQILQLFHCKLFKKLVHVSNRIYPFGKYVKPCHWCSLILSFFFLVGCC